MPQHDNTIPKPPGKAFTKPRPSASPGFLARTISSRVDAASGVISVFLLVASLASAAALLGWVVWPEHQSRLLLERRVSEAQRRVDNIKNDCREALDELDALDDPYELAQYALSVHGFHWREPSQK